MYNYNKNEELNYIKELILDLKKGDREPILETKDELTKLYEQHTISYGNKTEFNYIHEDDYSQSFDKDAEKENYIKKQGEK